MNRRAILTGVLGLAGAGAGAAIYSYMSMGSMADYDAMAARSREQLAVNPDLREIVRYATFAANSHNTQPWTFALKDSGIVIGPDLRRRTGVVDPDDHHLYVSMGCATENLVLAAAASGRAADVRYDSDADGSIAVDFATASAQESPLFGAIPLRQCTRSEYSGAAISADQLALLETAAQEPGIAVRFVTGKPDIEMVLEFIVAANRAQMADPGFVKELASWLRFNPAEAMRNGDGLFSASSGNPLLPSWIGSAIFPMVFKESAETGKIVRQVRSSSGLAIFSSERDDREHWARAGRAYQRFALQATALGIRNAHLNQPVEVASMRPEFATALGLGTRRPDLVIRFGMAQAMPMSLRRPVESVIR